MASTRHSDMVVTETKLFMEADLQGSSPSKLGALRTPRRTFTCNKLLMWWLNSWLGQTDLLRSTEAGGTLEALRPTKAFTAGLMWAAAELTACAIDRTPP